MKSEESKGTNYLELFPEFLKKSSIHGLNIFLFYVPIRYAKRIWFALIMFLIVYTHYVITTLTLNFLHQPTEVHMSTKTVHVANSPFPCVAFCSANKISRRKLLVLAERAFNAQQKIQPGLVAQNVQQMSEHLVILAGFYLHPYYDVDSDEQRLNNLHRIFTEMFNTSNYLMRETLHDLAPDCDNLVLKIHVLGELLSLKDFIVKRTTSSSICCMFNYRRESITPNMTRREIENSVIMKSSRVLIESNTMLNNLQFVVQYDEEDVTYKELTNDAFQLIIFPNQDYASLQSNTVGEILVEHNTIIEVPIQPHFFAASPAIRSFPPSARKCYFPDEGQKIINQSYYSLDECLLLCRMNSMIRYCGCLAPSMLAIRTNASQCGFLDLSCLTKWKAIWYGWSYFDYVNNDRPNLESSYEGCDHCLPTCDGIEFDKDVNTFPLRIAGEKGYKNGLLAGLNNSKPLAIIKLFYKQRFAQETIEEIVADWILLLSMIDRYGGILSLMYGFSIVSYIEIFYFLTGKWFSLSLSMKRKNAKGPTVKKISEKRKEAEIPKPIDNAEEVPPNYQLYWEELLPKGFDANNLGKTSIRKFKH